MTDSKATLDRVYGAVADSTRRAILGMLIDRANTVGEIAARFPISLNAVSKHLKVLERAGLVRRRIDGTQHWLQLTPGPLRQASGWLDTYRVFWEHRLEALEAVLLEDRAARLGARRRQSRQRVKSTTRRKRRR